MTAMRAGMNYVGSGLCGHKREILMFRSPPPNRKIKRAVRVIFTLTLTGLSLYLALSSAYRNLFERTAQAATFTVTNTADSGDGSLRKAILDANAAAGTDTI